MEYLISFGWVSTVKLLYNNVICWDIFLQNKWNIIIKRLDRKLESELPSFFLISQEKSFGFCLHDKAANTVYGTIQRLTCASLHKVPEYGYCL